MKIGILGFGNVASATVENLIKNQAVFLSKARSPIEIARIATRTPSRAYDRVPSSCVVDDDALALVNDPDIDVVIELTGDIEHGRNMVLHALKQGKHIITANKALLAHHGNEIMAAAEKEGRRVLFEGAVAVSIPIIKILREAAAANNLSSVVGILNGTCNFILSQMVEHDKDFTEALEEAQHLGYAEADPTLDINGEDSAHKITLLASLAFGVPIDFGAVMFKGITDIERLDIEFTNRLGFQIKLIAQARLEKNSMLIRVQPTLIPNNSMLAQVGGSMNGISIEGDLLGSAFFYGSGAGGRQTSSAILSDLLELVNSGGQDKDASSYNMGFRKHNVAPVYPQEEFAEPFYIRLSLEDKVGALAKVSNILADSNISIHSLKQDGPEDDLSYIVILTHCISDDLLEKALPKLLEASASGQPVIVFPVLEKCPEVESG